MTLNSIPVALAKASVPLVELMVRMGGQIRFVSEKLLSIELSSTVEALATVNTLVIGPGMSARMTMLAVRFVPLGKGPTSQATPSALVVIRPCLFVDRKKVKFVGMGHCTTASVTVAGPRLVTARLKVSSPPVRNVGTQ